MAFRQGHIGISTQPSIYRWLTIDQWQPSFIFFQDRVSQQLCGIDGIIYQEAENIVDEVFERYLERYLGNPKVRRSKIAADRISKPKEMRRDPLLSQFFELR